MGAQQFLTVKGVRLLDGVGIVVSCVDFRQVEFL